MPTKEILNVIMLIAIILIPTSKENRNPTKIGKTSCTDDSCTWADNILNKMDPSVDPCEDFYSYACNGWIKSNSEKKWRFAQQLIEENQMVIKRVLEQPEKNLKSLTERKARTFYESCMDVKTITKLKEKPMLGVIRKLGGWSTSIDKRWSFQKIVQRVSNRYSVDVFFRYTVASDSRNSSKYILQIRRNEQPPFSHFSYLTGPTRYRILHFYMNQMTRAGVLLGGEPISTKKRIQNVLRLEGKIGNLRSHSLSTFLTLTELNNKVKFINWVAFFKNAQRVFKWKFDMQQEIDLRDLVYFKELSQLIKGYLKTDKGRIVLNDYMTWRTVFSLVHAMPKSFMKVPPISKAFKKPRWKKCIEETQAHFSFATSTIYVREAFHSSSKKHAEKVFQNIRSAFRKNIQGLDWMSEIAKRAFINKLDVTSVTIGYPDIFENITRADNLYENLLIRNNTYFQNTAKIIHYLKEKELQKIDESVTVNLEEVNAYFDPDKNNVRIPAGILRNPLYGPNLPLSLNYGGIGIIMGHELAHAFDDRSRRYIMQDDYKTKEQFYMRTECFPKQYGDGSEDITNESVADNGGIKSAFRAYLDLKDNAESETLPKLLLNHRQLFFVAFAQTWCSSQNETLEMMVDLTHTPGKMRVNGVLRNNEHFGEEFGCKIGTRMNPSAKCELW